MSRRLSHAAGWLLAALGYAGSLARAEPPPTGDEHTEPPAVEPKSPASTVAPTEPSASSSGALTSGAAESSAHESVAADDAELARWSGAGSDVELNAASAMLASEAPDYPHLSLYGFSDFSYSRLFLPHDSLLSEYYSTRGSFAVGNANLYIDSQISQRARSLMEFRFSFLPNGTTTVNPNSGQLVRTDTTVNDYAILGRSSKWAAITIERIVLSYDFHPAFTISVGRFITPWGIWNIDHGSPTLISPINPLVMDDEYIPRRQTGLQISGSWLWRAFRTGYFLTLSNGRGPVDTYRDFDRNKAFGGRVFVTSSLLGELTLGGTFYRGRYTDPHTQFVRVNPDGTDAHIETVYKTEFMETALAADIKWEWKGLFASTEITVLGRRYAEDGRVPNYGHAGRLPLDGRPSFSPDTLWWGGYVLLGYRFEWLGVMPFLHLDYTHTDEYVVPTSLGIQAGLNIRPEPGLVLKLMVGQVRFLHAAPVLAGEEPTFMTFTSQLAWAF